MDDVDKKLREILSFIDRFPAPGHNPESALLSLTEDARALTDRVLEFAVARNVGLRVLRELDRRAGGMSGRDAVRAQRVFSVIEQLADPGTFDQSVHDIYAVTGLNQEWRRTFNRDLQWVLQLMVETSLAAADIVAVEPIPPDTLLPSKDVLHEGLARFAADPGSMEAASRLVFSAADVPLSPPERHRLEGLYRRFHGAVIDRFRTFSVRRDRELVTSLLGLIEPDNRFGVIRKAAPTSIIQVGEELLNKLAQDPEILWSLSPRGFEEVVAAIFRKFGMEVHLTPRTRDGGIDVIAFADNKYTKDKYIIECKLYGPEKKVGLGIVQRLYGVKVSGQASKAFLVTSSRFSEPARRFANQHLWELDLKDHDDLLEWLRRFWLPYVTTVAQ